jgi:AcrR family transcriptional regulator
MAVREFHPQGGQTRAQSPKAQNCRVAAKGEVPIDPARSLALLWGTHGKVGRSGLTVEKIVEAAIDIADRDGLDAVSMRRIAEHLGVGAMSLYTHVPGKHDLIDLITDHVVGELYRDVDEPVRSGGGWRGALTHVAERNWELFQRHPWLLQLDRSRPVLGPNTTDNYEAELRPLDGVGLTDVEMDSVLTLVLTHVAGTAKALTAVKQTTSESGMTDAQWWSATAPILERLIDPTRYPVASRVGTTTGVEFDAASNPAHAMRFGLDRILDGIGVLIDQRRSS